jgi:hypothetical protein
LTETKDTSKKKRSVEPSSAQYAAMDSDTKAMLDAQEKVRIRAYQVPADSSDRPLPDLTVAINGYVYQIKRGEWVEVPQTVADILAESGHI